MRSLSFRKLLGSCCAAAAVLQQHLAPSSTFWPSPSPTPPPTRTPPVEETSNAMALDGIMYDGVGVRVRRPNDYNAAAGEGRAGSQCNATASTAKQYSLVIVSHQPPPGRRGGESEEAHPFPCCRREGPGRRPEQCRAAAAVHHALLRLRAALQPRSSTRTSTRRAACRRRSSCDRHPPQPLASPTLCRTPQRQPGLASLAHESRAPPAP